MKASKISKTERILASILRGKQIKTARDATWFWGSFGENIKLAENFNNKNALPFIYQHSHKWKKIFSKCNCLGEGNNITKNF